MRDDLYDGMPYWKVDDKPPWSCSIGVSSRDVSEGLGCHSRWFY